MDLNLERSRMAFNTMNGKESVPPRFKGKLPINPYFDFLDSEQDMRFGAEYGGDMAELIHMQKEDL